MDKKKLLSVMLIPIIILLEQTIKNISLNKNIEIIPNILEFTYTQNTGIAFEIGANMTLVIITSIVMLLGIMIFIITKFKKIKYVNLIALYIIIAGGISNLIDRMYRGFVIDYLDIRLFAFPTFNLADILIVIGIGILLIDSIKNKNYRRSKGC